MAVATVDDVATSLGRPITDDAEVAQVNQWLGDAEMQIRLRLGDVALLDQEALAFVERESVILKMRNPEGYQSESVDDYTYRWGNGSGRVAILDEWWNMLTPSTATAAFTIRPYGAPDSSQPDAWATTTEQV
jgi:hypothetical protein